MTFRRGCIVVIILLYLCGVFPPFMSVYNSHGFIFGIPKFMFGILTLSFSMILSIVALYYYEECRQQKNPKELDK